MKRVFKKFATSLLLALPVFVVSCDIDSGHAQRGLTVSGYVSKGSNTIVPEEATLDALQSLRADGTLMFDGAPAQLSEAAAGDILAIPACDAIPGGGLLKITSIRMRGRNLLLGTTQAHMDEAVEDADFEITKTLSSDDVQEFKPLARGVTMQQLPADRNGNYAWQAPDIVLNLRDAILLDLDANPLTTGDQVRARGKLVITPGFDFRVKIKGFMIREVYYKNKTGESSELTVSCGEIGKKLVSFDAAIEVARFQFLPIVIPITGFPLVIAPALTLKIGASGKVSFAMSTTLRQSGDLALGVHYEKGRWKPVAHVGLGYSMPNPSVKAEASVRCYAMPEFDLQLFGALGLFMDISEYLELTVENMVKSGNAPDRLRWRLTGGFSAGLGVELAILSLRLAGYRAKLIDVNAVIHEGLVGGSLLYDEHGLANEEYRARY